MSLYEDPYRKTVWIPVTVTKGVVSEYGKGSLPPIQDGSVGELVLRLSSILNLEDQKRLAGEKSVPFFPPGTELWVHVSPHHIADELKGHAVTWNGAPGPLVRVVLNGALMMRLRGIKAATLIDVACTIPALNTDALSVNHAYRLVSEKFEPHRRSHAGNVFKEVFVVEDEMAQQLDFYRAAIEIQMAGAGNPAATSPRSSREAP
jgi:hypothetical protein